MENTSIIFLVLCVCLLLSSSIGAGVGAWFYIKNKEASQAAQETPETTKPLAVPVSSSTPAPALTTVSISPLTTPPVQAQVATPPVQVQAQVATPPVQQQAQLPKSVPVAVVAATPTQVAKALDNYKILKNNDYPGNDIKCYTDGKSAEECAKLCNDDKSCVGLAEIQKNSVWGEKSGCCTKNKFGNRGVFNGVNFYYKKDQTLPVDKNPYPIAADQFTPCITNSDAVNRGYTWRDDAATQSCIEAGYQKWSKAQVCDKINDEDTYKFRCLRKNPVFKRTNDTASAGGGGGGGPYDLICPEGSFVKEFYGKGGWELDRIGVKCSNGQDMGYRGGDGGGDFSTGNRDNGFNKIEVKSGNIVNYIKFFSDNNEVSKTGDNDWRPTVMGCDEKIIGLKVKSGSKIDNIQAVCGEFF